MLLFGSAKKKPFENIRKIIFVYWGEKYKTSEAFQNHLIAHMFKIYRFFSYLFYLARLELLYTDFQLALPLFYIIACNILYILSCFLQFCRLEVIITDWYAPLCRSAVTFTSPPRWPCSWTQDRSVTILHINNTLLPKPHKQFTSRFMFQIPTAPPNFTGRHLWWERLPWQ